MSINNALNNVINLLNGFVADPLFADKYALAFNNAVTSQQYLAALSTLPTIEIRSNQELNGALGAFSGQTDKIYLSQGLVDGDSAQLEAVLIEEIGHYKD